MIKIGPLYATDYAQIRSLLKLQPEYELTTTAEPESSFLLRGFTFWQHWVPCQWHLAPSVYLARENNVVIGLIAVRSLGKSKETWQIDHLAVHPDHRGRGVAQELVRYVFAQFGSQGAGHFIAELSDQNLAGLGLFSSCGFRRCTKIKHFRINCSEIGTISDTEQINYRTSTAHDAQAVFQLFQEALPSDIRLVLGLSAGDFVVDDSAWAGFNQLKQRVSRKHIEYWLTEDPKRQVLTSAMKLTLHDAGPCQVEFAIHPGWQENTKEIVSCALMYLKSKFGTGTVYARCFGFQTHLIEAINHSKMENVGEYFLLAREHWVRAKRKKGLLSRPDLSAIPNVVINFPSPST